MGQLIVRNLDNDIIEALKARARANGRSAEAEHREILRLALEGPAAGHSFWDWLRAMPDDGEELELERDRQLPRGVDL